MDTRSDRGAPLQADREGPDAVDALLKRAATWEPPDGFAMRVVAASRMDERRHTPVPRSLAGIGATARLRAWMTALATRRQSAIWVLRQYWSLLRGR
jgi:hypothetical protein